MTVSSLSTPVRHRFSIAWRWPFASRPRRQRKPNLPADLTHEQIKDAGIAWELAGYGRGAAVSMLAITIAQSHR